MRNIRELASLILRHAPESGLNATAAPRLSLLRQDHTTVPTPTVQTASLCLIAQGAKRVSLGGYSVIYDASHYLIVSLDLPLVGHVTLASPDAPYLCCKIDLDQAMLADMLTSIETPSRMSETPALAVYPADPELVDAACRMTALLDRPEDISALAPLIEREIIYRLLTGPHAASLRRITMADSHMGQISRAITKIRSGFRQQLRIDDIAAAAGMSPSSLHQHFKTITRMTPLEYQKQLRLQEARRMMMAEGASAGAAGFAVGYDSPSQFSREYRRLFGAPPRRDIENLHPAMAQTA